jgi:hypothetical protein
VDNAQRLYRLRHAVKVMERVEASPAHKFDLRDWQWGTYPNFHQTEEEAVSCGTACCFAGWLALDPIAQAQGLKPNKGGIPTFGVGDDETTQASAIANYLGISYEAARNLVIPDEYKCDSSQIKPADVICKLERLIEAYEQN